MFFGFKEKLERIFGKPVDLITHDSLGNPYFRESVEASKQLVFEGWGREISVPLYSIPFLSVMPTMLGTGTLAPDTERFSASTLIEAGACVSASTPAAMDSTDLPLSQ